MRHLLFFGLLVLFGCNQSSSKEYTVTLENLQSEVIKEFSPEEIIASEPNFFKVNAQFNFDSLQLELNTLESHEEKSRNYPKRIRYQNSDGNTLYIINQNKEGEIAREVKNGIAIYHFQYDQEGNLKQKAHYNSVGKLFYNDVAPIELFKYDSRNRVIAKIKLDTDEKPLEGNSCLEIYSYNDRNLLFEKKIYDLHKGKYILQGAQCIWQYYYDSFGRVSRIEKMTWQHHIGSGGRVPIIEYDYSLIEGKRLVRLKDKNEITIREYWEDEWVFCQ